ncbi:aminoglycoside phosphotransferase family protein [Salipiger sp.]|uniref:aminoglycoside phosphotransferase family protein n=1 Tax=Salipiger sp. TaxID=2078585 RepID=UPI003A9818E0
MSVLTGTPWEGARAEPLAGDASSRRYSRLHLGERSAILMLDPEGDTALFARLARHLRAIGLSAPGILAERPGELLLEDLGDGLVARLATSPEAERRLYLCATDALIALHGHPPPEELTRATPERLAAMTDLAFDWYAGGQDDARTACADAFREALERHAPVADVMILRDYHAENILYLPDRSGPAQAGLLDFQDALTGHRAYDLVSLLEDARRDVAPDTVEACLRHYLDRTGTAEVAFRAAFAVLGAQRNLRILGVFARLAATRGKPGYLALIPRVWGHLRNDLAHPALAGVRGTLTRLPAPDAAWLERLRTSCPTP